MGEHSRVIHVETTEREYTVLSPEENVIMADDEEVIAIEWVDGNPVS